MQIVGRSKPTRRPCSTAFRAQVFRQSEMKFEGLRTGPQIAALTPSGQSLCRQLIDVSVDRAARVIIPVAAIEPADLTIDCATIEARCK
jgi:hypothetical protein